MQASPQIQNHRPAPSARAIRPNQRKSLRVTITTDGSWFTVQGDKKDEAGFELHFSTDGSNAEVSVHTGELRSPVPALRLYVDPPA